MALDEWIFGRVVRYFKNRKSDAEDVSCTVHLAPLQPRLTLLARALTGRPVALFPAIREGGFRGNSFFLPEKCGLFDRRERNVEFYIFRVLYLSVQQHLSLNWYRPEPPADAESIALSLQSAPRVIASMEAVYPESHALYQRLLADLPPGTSVNWLYGKWMADAPEEITHDRIAKIPDAPKEKPEVLQPATILTARPVEEMVSLDVDIRQQEDYVLTHNFEKVETADEFSGNWRDFDGDDELEKHQDALDELRMKYTVRVNDTVHSIYEAGFTADVTVAESESASAAGHHIPYDEWDCFKKQYKRGYSKVFPLRQTAQDAEYCRHALATHRLLLEQLRRMLTAINNKWAKQKRQWHGDEVDTDRVTDRYAEMLAGRTPSDDIYIAGRKKEKDLSILLLLDLSLSSDSYAAGNRVIDISKQTAILFGEILDEFGIDFSICGFYSQTRNYTAYLTLKDFDEKWKTAKRAVGAPRPEGYTRIGPALRHAGALLQSRPANNRWIVLLSDGKPNDFDRYEGRYGIGDVKQALRELSAGKVNTYALAIEAAARYYLPQMFGHDHYEILSSPNALLTKLIRLYERIRYGR